MKWLFFVVLPLLVLSACTNENLEAPPMPVTQTATADSGESTPYKITIETPVSGDTILVGVVNTIQGRIEPIPQQSELHIYFEVENGWHQHYDRAVIDPETGEWSVANPIHPNYTGPAQLVAALIETGDTPPLAQQSVDVYLDYDPTDDAVYVNLNQPKSENNLTRTGEILTLEGASHNPIQNQIVIQIKDCANETILRQELIETPGGPWQLDVLIPPEFAGLDGGVCIFACTGDDDWSEAAWCGWQNVHIESK